MIDYDKNAWNVYSILRKDFSQILPTISCFQPRLFCTLAFRVVFVCRIDFLRALIINDQLKGHSVVHIPSAPITHGQNEIAGTMRMTITSVELTFPAIAPDPLQCCDSARVWCLDWRMR